MPHWIPRFRAILSYIIIMADASSMALYQVSGWPASDWNQRRTCIVVLTVVFILPAVLLRDISKLEKLSTASVITVVVVVAVVAIKYFTLPYVDWDGGPLSGDALSECSWSNGLPTGKPQATATHLPASYFSSDAAFAGPGIFNAFSIIAFSFVCHDSAFLMFQVSKSLPACMLCTD